MKLETINSHKFACIIAQYLDDKLAKNITILNIISAPEGIKKVINNFPKVKIYTTSIDEKLNEKGYITPGLGDAGDRIFNTIY